LALITGFIGNARAEPTLAEPLTLSAAEQLLMSHNIDLTAARLDVRSAQADRISAGQRPNPTLSLSGNYYYGPYPVAPYSHYGPGGALDSTVAVSQLFERGNKRSLREDAATSEVSAAGADLEDTVRRLHLQLAQSYYALAAAEESERIARANAELYRQSVGAMQLRLKAGDISPVESTRMQVASDQADIALRQAVDAHREARRELALLLDEVPHADEIRTAVKWDLKHTLPLSNPEKPDFSAILSSRPDVAAAQARVSQAQATHKLALAQRKSDLTVGIQYEHMPSGSSISTHDVGVNLSFPLQIRYQNQGEIESTEVAREKAVAQLAAIRARALQELQKAWSDLYSARAQVENYQEGIIPKAEQNAEATEFAYKQGSGSLTDLLDARRTFHSILLDAVNARAGYAITQAQWRAATNR
jgi:cobalt-zinc-cadmium efflux system outer membrane protein